VQLHAKKIHLLTAQGNFSLVLWVGHKIILLYLGLLHFTFLQTSFYVSLQFVVLVCCDRLLSAGNSFISHPCLAPET
jgi:hypothetical protein